MQQNIITERLILRPFRSSDSERVAELAGDKIIADMTANIPHPYHPEMAVDWIQTHEPHFLEGKGVIYAITLKGSDDIIGAVSFPSLENGLGTLGYWLGVSFWGRGIAFEASQALITHSQIHLGLRALHVMHLAENERSKSVILKLGVEYIETRILQIHGESREVCVYSSSL
ncbi:GNAT family N-acetyltransferase [Photobacterium nomapromontoriensis]|uniref:GNAT family N-acetyltransferase n=1 Tax=Photobacterium nomapromontoriensis TaxID=2910237 RepID=UPI003D0A9D39